MLLYTAQSNIFCFDERKFRLYYVPRNTTTEKPLLSIYNIQLNRNITHEKKGGYVVYSEVRYVANLKAFRQYVRTNTPRKPRELHTKHFRVYIPYTHTQRFRSMNNPEKYLNIS